MTATPIACERLAGLITSLSHPLNAAQTIPTWYDAMENDSVGIDGWCCSVECADVPYIKGVGHCSIQLLAARKRIPAKDELFESVIEAADSIGFFPSAARAAAVHDGKSVLACLFRCVAPDGVDLAGEELDAAIKAIEEACAARDGEFGATVVIRTTKFDDTTPLNF